MLSITHYYGLSSGPFELPTARDGRVISQPLIRYNKTDVMLSTDVGELLAVSVLFVAQCDTALSPFSVLFVAQCDTALSPFNLHGSLLMQSMLQFSAAADVVVHSLLSLSSSQLRSVCCDQAGSHVITTFVKSPTVNKQSRSQLYQLMQVALPALANSLTH